MKTFEQCCEYLGIDNTLPTCQIDEKKFQAAYKLRVCMDAWNKQDEFEPDETGGWDDKNVGYTPSFRFKNGILLSAGGVYSGASTGIIISDAPNTAAYAYINCGLSLSLKTTERAIEFGETFLDIFNELI